MSGHIQIGEGLTLGILAAAVTISPGSPSSYSITPFNRPLTSISIATGILITMLVLLWSVKGSGPEGIPENTTQRKKYFKRTDWLQSGLNA